jgi:hypothetical protein
VDREEDSMIDSLLVMFQRRIIAAVMLTVAGWLGLGDEGASRAQQIAVSVSAFLPAAGMLWSYLQKIERRELYRRLIAGVIPAVYALLGAIAGEMSDSERAGIAQGVGSLLQSILGDPSPEVLGLAAGAGALGMWSFKSENKLQPGKLSSPNP